MKTRKDASETPRKHKVSKEEKKDSCGIYKQTEHNKRTCTQVERPPKIYMRKKHKVRQRQE